MNLKRCSTLGRNVQEPFSIGIDENGDNFKFKENKFGLVTP
jgi:hypothetical protein